MVAAGVWCFSAVFGFEQYGLPTVLFGLALAYSGSVAYAWRSWSDRRRAGLRTSVRSMHLKLTGSMLLVLVLDGAGYLLAVRSAEQREPSMVSALQDIFVAVAMLTISVGLVLPGMIAHASSEVMRAADDLARHVLPDLARAMEALSRGELAATGSHRSPPPVVVHGEDEIGAMAASFNAMLDEVERTEHALDGAAERLRMYTDGLEDLVSQRTRALVVANAALQEAQADRRTLLARTVRAGEEERTRIAADLHDGPIQRLAALGLLLDRCELRLSRGDSRGSGELVAAARNEISDQIHGLRRLMSELRPPVLDQGGLPAALSDHLASFRSRYGVSGELRIDLDAPLEAQIETTVYRLVQESLTNVGKHAAAESVVVSVREEEGGLAVQVEDDGIGMPAQTDAGTIDMAQLLRDGHCGLAGMRERVELVGGRFALGGGDRGGTRVSVWLPRAVSGVPVQAVVLP
jgi:signal transduction histidine kinase